MSSSPPTPADLSAVLHELRQIRRDSVRREDEVWSAIDEIRGLLMESLRDGGGNEEGTSAAERLPGGGNYGRLKRRLRRFATSVLPEGGRVAVVSRGDDELLDLPHIEAEHFPRAIEGGYSGYYPADGTALIAHLEWVRANGAGGLLFPETSMWWLESFPRFASHLERTCPPPTREEGVGMLFDLTGGTGVARGWTAVLADLIEAWEEEMEEHPSVLDWKSDRGLAERFPGCAVFSPPDDGETLPYLDGSVDIVVVTDEPVRVEEARRVAGRALVRFPRRSAAEACADAIIVEHKGEPPGALPSASVIIPTYDGLPHLIPCLRSLATTLPGAFQGEVIVVDDGGSGETGRVLRDLRSRYAWLRVVRNQENAGFVASCNRGAEEAAADYLIFLNDDTVALPGWLGALLRTFRTAADAGAVGGRLVYPDGRLQEAGGVIYRDASGANVGRDDYEVDAPLYRYLRRVDYCSGALLATPRALFQRLGGFDTRYRPAYYEDTDYCFSVREAGLGVYYQPDATVVHAEGATSGTDPGQGAKRHQEVNRKAFSAKWAAMLEQMPEPPSSYSSRTWHRVAVGGGAV